MEITGKLDHGNLEAILRLWIDLLGYSPMSSGQALVQTLT